MFEEALKLILENDCIIIHRHANPDGDALGSQIGLFNIIKDTYPEKKVFKTGDCAGRYSFMKDSLMDEIPDDLYGGALSVVLDTSSEELISDLRFRQAKTTLRFDHHLFLGKICDCEVVDSSFESCAGLITAFARDCGMKISPDAANALFTGIVTDSGRFRFDSVSPRTFSLAAFLLEHGADMPHIYSSLYTDELDNIRMRAEFILKIKRVGVNVAYIYTDIDEVRRLGANPFSISRSMVGVMSDVNGVDIWVNFTESENGVLCEIRSSKYNINPIAVKYGGGGHSKASGATVPDRFAAMNMLSDLIVLGENQQ